MAAAPERRMVEVAGAGIEALCWGEVGASGLLLLHGNGASASWWSYIAPFFAASHRVVAMSWSGMGGSQWRERYSLDLHVREMLEVSEATGLFDSAQAPQIVAHSFGGYPTIACAARHGERFAGITLVDTAVRTAEERAARAARKQSVSNRVPRETRVYPSFEQAIERFRFLPEQPCEHLFIVDHIARTSLREVSDDAATAAGAGTAAGWTWRFDPFLWRHYSMGTPTSDLQRARCPVSVIYGDQSQLVDAARARYIAQLAPGTAPVIAIPQAQHHVMVDQPLAFVAALRALFSVAQPSSVQPAAGAAAA